MMLQTYSKIPLYRASAQVQIQDERTTAVGNLDANNPMFWQDSEQYYNTQYSILASRGLAKRVVQPHAAAESSALQRQRAAERADRWRSCARRGRRSATTVRGLWSRDEADDAGGRSRPPDENAHRERPHRPVPRRRRTSCRSRRRGWSKSPTSRPIRRSRRWPRRRWPRSTRSRTSICGSRRSPRTCTFLGEEVAKQEKKVTEAEAAMARYRDKQNALSLEDRTNIVGARLNTLNETVTRARTNRLQKEALLQPAEGHRPEERRRGRLSASSRPTRASWKPRRG